MSVPQNCFAITAKKKGKKCRMVWAAWAGMSARVLWGLLRQRQFLALETTTAAKADIAPIRLMMAEALTRAITITIITTAIAIAVAAAAVHTPTHAPDILRNLA